MIQVIDEGWNTMKIRMENSLLAEDLSVTANILTSIGIHEPSYDDCYIIREVCKTVSLRAAKLAAAGNSSIDLLITLRWKTIFLL